MSFDAGSISGKLELDPEGFTSGMLKAEGIAELFPEVVKNFLASPLLGLADTVKETFDFVKESIASTIDEASQTGFNAEKIGVHAEWLSQWSGVAKTVGVDQDRLTNGMFLLTRQVGDALEGNKAAQKGFENLGISMQWLGEHSNDTAAIFEEVEKRLSSMEDKTKRNAAAQEVLGRSVRDLAPIFSMNAADIQHIMEMQQKLGDVTDDEEARQGQAAKKLEAEWSMAVEGIKKAIGSGFMDEIVNRSPEIEAALSGDSASARALGKDLGDLAVDGIPLLIKGLQELDTVLKDVNFLMNEMSASDLKHLTIGGKHFGINWGPEVPQQTMHSGPVEHDPNRKPFESRSSDEDLIFRQFGKRPTPDWSDEQVERMAARAREKQAGSYTAFSHPNAVLLAEAQAPAYGPPTPGTASASSTPAPDWHPATAGPMGPTTPDAIAAHLADSSPSRSHAHHSQHAKTHGVGGDIHIGTMNVHIDPNMTDAQMGRKMREIIKQAQSLANVQASVAGS